MVCFKCDKKFKHRKDLRRHAQKCLGKVPYTCSKCDISFDRIQAMRQHSIRIHKEEKTEFRFTVTQQETASTSGSANIAAGSEPQSEMDDRGDSTKQSNTDSLSAGLYPLTSVKIEDNRLSPEHEHTIKNEID